MVHESAGCPKVDILEVGDCNSLAQNPLSRCSPGTALSSFPQLFFELLALSPIPPLSYFWLRDLISLLCSLEPPKLLHRYATKRLISEAFQILEVCAVCDQLGLQHQPCTNFYVGIAAMSGLPVFILLIWKISSLFTFISFLFNAYLLSV